MANIQRNINQVISMFAGLATGGKLVKGQKETGREIAKGKEEIVKSQQELKTAGSEIVKSQQELAEAIKLRETEIDKLMAYEADKYEAMYKNLEAEAFEAGYDSVEAYESAISAGRARAAEQAKVRLQEQERMNKFKQSIFQGTPYAYTDNPEMLKRGAK